jgi:NuA3 HAT complex component NTO1
MPSQDQEWLDAVNTERRNDQLNKVSYETFEIIMDKLEKEWFDLVSCFSVHREHTLNSI